MRIRLKGINVVRKRLADGSIRAYYYAWKGGPALRGAPGTPEFVASYNEAVARKAVVPRGTLLSVLQRYQQSEAFLGLADSTRRAYIALIVRIEKQFGDFPLAALTDRRSRGVFMAWRDKLAADSGRRQADYAWTVLARVLSWGLDRGIVMDNPCARASLAIRVLRPCLKWAERRGLVRAGVANLEQPGKSGKRERVVTTDELSAVWPHLQGAHGNVIKWLLWTGCRLNEAVGMTWGEVNDDLWTIPAARSKNGRSRAVPLPRQALDLLGATRGGALPEPDALIFPSKGDGKLSNWDRETKRLHQLSGTSTWHRHDLRRAVATLLGDLGFAPHVLSVVLGHAHIADGATAVYARSRYQREHRKALQALADEIDRLVKSGDNVVRLVAVQV
jgi:integrase